MENATKALLIAAAVLIVILIIAFGMRIFNSTSDVSGQAQDVGHQLSTSTSSASGILQAQLGVAGGSSETGGSQSTSEADSFNIKFKKYIGNNISKTNAIDCIREIVKTMNTDHPISGTIILKNGSININTNASNIDQIIKERVVGTKYQIVIGGKDSNGYINKISIIYIA